MAMATLFQRVAFLVLISTTVVYSVRVLETSQKPLVINEQEAPLRLIPEELKSFLATANALQQKGTGDCPRSCSQSGVCVEGRCMCHPGFSDLDCSVNDTVVGTPDADLKSLYAGLPQVEGKRLRVAIFSSELLESNVNSDAGLGMTYLAKLLASHSHEVVFVYPVDAHDHSFNETVWTDFYKTMGISFEPIMMSKSLLTQVPSTMKKSYETYRWLKGEVSDSRPFDVVHFPVHTGLGYFSVMAKHQGLAFHNVPLVVSGDTPWVWSKPSELQTASNMADLEIDWMERQSVALCDLFVSSSSYMSKWMRSHGWHMPIRSVIQPPAYLAHPEAEVARDIIAFRHVKELVFLGSFDEFKGLDLFESALDELSTDASHKDLTVTFLVVGTEASEHQLTRLKSRASQWPFHLQIAKLETAKEAFGYLVGGSSLVVIPPTVENSPFAVRECLAGGIPFIASHVGAISELVSPSDWERVLFKPDKASLVKQLKLALGVGVAPVAPAPGLDSNNDVWMQFHNHLSQIELNASDDVRSSADNHPLVTICVFHRNTASYLVDAIASIQDQEYVNFDVVLVDDGSDHTDAKDAINELESMFKVRGWTIIRQKEAYAGAARNAAAAAAKGSLLMFMDASNFAKPTELSTLVKVISKTSADIVTCGVDLFHGQHAPTSQDLAHPSSTYVYLGEAAVLGAFKNVFGSSNFLVKKSVFMNLGGFTEDFGSGSEEWEFFAKAALTGHHLEAVPEALYLHRVTESSVNSAAPTQTARMRGLRPYVDMLPADLRSVLLHTHMSIGPPCPNDCNKRGTCDGGVCRCDAGWDGPDCSTKMIGTPCPTTCPPTGCPAGCPAPCPVGGCPTSGPCPPGCPPVEKLPDHPLPVTFECSGHGLNVNGECFCYAGYTGVKCQMPITSCPNECSHHGKCWQGKCFCQTDWTGNDCSVNKLAPAPCACKVACTSSPCPACPCANECSGHGKIVDGTCFCEGGWTGSDCSTCIKNLMSTPPLFHREESSSQTTVASSDSPSTLSPPQSSSIVPQGHTPCPNDCSGHGECTDSTCYCKPNYSGADCSQFLQCPNNCNGIGICSMGRCMCPYPFSGTDCHIKEGKGCPNDCNNQGICAGTECLCKAGYTGADCSRGPYPTLGSLPTSANVVPKNLRPVMFDKEQ